MPHVLILPTGPDRAGAGLAAPLRAAGWRVTVLERAPAPAGAVARARPDLVVLDARPDDEETWTALRSLTREPATAEIPVLVVASETQPGAKIRAFWLGARDYLVRPVEGSRLLLAARALTDDRIREPSIAV